MTEKTSPDSDLPLCVCVSQFKDGEPDAHIYPIEQAKNLAPLADHVELSDLLRILEGVAKTSAVKKLREGDTTQSAYAANAAIKNIALPLIGDTYGCYKVHKDRCQDSDAISWDPRRIGIQIPLTRPGGDLLSPDYFVGISHYVIED